MERLLVLSLQKPMGDNILIGGHSDSGVEMLG